jgi:hypothetical protein
MGTRLFSPSALLLIQAVGYSNLGLRDQKLVHGRLASV